MGLKDFLDRFSGVEFSEDTDEQPRSDRLKSADDLFDRAVCDLDSREFQSGLRKLVEAQRIYLEERDPFGVAATSINMGILFGRCGQLEKAVRFLIRAADLCEGTGNRFHEIEAQLALAHCYLRSNNRKKAKECFNRASKLANKINDQTLKLRVLSESAALHADVILEQDDYYRIESEGDCPPEMTD